PRDIAMWLSGYYNGKRNNTVLDTQEFRERTRKVMEYPNPKTTDRRRADPYKPVRDGICCLLFLRTEPRYLLNAITRSTASITVPLLCGQLAPPFPRRFLHLLAVDRRRVAPAIIVTVQPNREMVGVGDLQQDQLLAGNFRDIDRGLRQRGHR